MHALRTYTAHPHAQHACLRVAYQHAKRCQTLSNASGLSVACTSSYKITSTHALRRHDCTRPQIEFYFSDSNLPRDAFLLSAVEEAPDGFVSLALICTFSRMRTLLELKGSEGAPLTAATVSVNPSGHSAIPTCSAIGFRVCVHATYAEARPCPDQQLTKYVPRIRGARVHHGTSGCGMLV